MAPTYRGGREFRIFIYIYDRSLLRLGTGSHTFHGERSGFGRLGIHPYNWAEMGQTMDDNVLSIVESGKMGKSGWRGRASLPTVRSGACVRPRASWAVLGPFDHASGGSAGHGDVRPVWL